MEKKEELKVLKIERERIHDCLLRNKSKIEALLKNPIVKKYEKLRLETENVLNDSRDILIKIDQLEKQICNHKLWYFLYEETDDYERRTYWTCKCVGCGTEKESRSRDFSHKNIIFAPEGINSTNLYKKINSDYSKLINYGKVTHDEIREILLSRYSKENIILSHDNDKLKTELETDSVLDKDEIRLVLKKRMNVNK